MPVRRPAFLLACCGALLGVAAAAAQEDGTAQLVFRATQALPASAIAYIADVSIPQPLTIPAGMSPEDVLRIHCGGAISQVYLDKVVDANPGLRRASSAAPREILAPACARWRPNVEVVVQRGDDLDTLLNREIGRSGNFLYNTCAAGGAKSRCDRPLREVVAAMNRLDDRQIASLTPGSRLTLPVVTEWTSFAVKTGAASPDQTVTAVVAKLNDIVAAEGFAVATSVAPVVIAAQTEPIEIIKPLGLDDPAIQAEGCRNAAERAGGAWPYDAAAVAALLSKNLAELARRGGEPTRIVIRVVDTGFKGVDSTLPRSLLQMNQFEVPNGRDDPPVNGWTDDIFGVSPDRTGSIEPFQDYFAMHGTEVADLALGGHSTGFQHPELGRLIRLTFVKAVSSTMLQPGSATSPPQFSYSIDEVTMLDSISRGQPIATIVNMSVGSSRKLQRIVDQLRVSPQSLLVTAAGNDGVPLLNQGWYPANYGGNGEMARQVITVGAHDGLGGIATFSNRGERVDLLAPGCEIPYRTAAGSTERLFGTSFAAPIVTFTAGLLRSLGLEDPWEIKLRLLASVDYDPGLQAVTLSSGRLNVERSLNVYRDVLRRSTDSKDLSGEWLRESAISPCEGVDIAADRVLKIARDTPGPDGRTLIRIIHRDSDNQPLKQICEPGGTTISFQPDGSEEVESVAWTEVVDFVPAYFAPTVSN
jgi:hypothetical protein